jgi:Phytochelatin synthase
MRLRMEKRCSHLVETAWSMVSSNVAASDWARRDCEMVLIKCIMVSTTPKTKEGPQMRSFHWLIVALLTLGFSVAQPNAQPLPLPDNLVDLRSEQGSKLLLESEALRSYWPLSANFVTQKSVCG